MPLIVVLVKNPLIPVRYLRRQSPGQAFVLQPEPHQIARVCERVNECLSPMHNGEVVDEGQVARLQGQLHFVGLRDRFDNVKRLYLLWRRARNVGRALDVLRAYNRFPPEIEDDVAVAVEE